MSSQASSKKVIVIAFLANLGIAIAKFAGAFYSGSAALLAEAIHSLVDCSNQILLFIGAQKSQKPADKVHPLGYGREAFFWSFVVAILLFSMGGLFAIYEGVHKLHSHEDVSSPQVALAVLAFSIILESYSFYACIKEVRIANVHGSLWNWFRKSKNSELLVIFTEDAAALAGLSVAAGCVGIFWATGNPLWDAIGSICIGVLLVGVAILLAIEIKSFIIGEAAEVGLKKFIEDAVPEMFPAGKLLNLIAIQTGSSEVMLSCKIHPGNITDVDTSITLVNELERRTKAHFPQVKWQFMELDKED